MSVVEELELVKTQLRKAKLELTAKLAELNANVESLTAALESADVVDEDVVNSLNDVRAVAQELDDLVPDVVVEEPVVAEEPVVEEVLEPVAEEAPVEE